MNRNIIGCLSAAFAAAVCLAAPGHAWGEENIDVSVNTSSIAGEAGSELYLELTGGGSDGGAGYNSVTTGPFALGGGGAGAVDTLDSIGNFSGNMSSGVSLDDNGSALNLFGQYFTSGSSLSFQMNVSTNSNTGAVPDGFFMYLYDPYGNPLAATTDPSGSDSLFEVEFNDSTPTVTSFAPPNEPNLFSVTSVATAVPELDPLSMLGAGTLLLGTLAVVRGRRPRQVRRAAAISHQAS